MILYASDDPGAIVYIKNFLKKTNYKIKHLKNLNSIKDIKTKIKIIITGAALGNTIDKKLIVWAKKNKILSISIIEHWTFFKKRFYFRGNYYYPDFILVNDKYSKKMALKEGLPKNKIIISGNEYLKNLIKNKPKIKLKDNKKILFISEPMSETHSKRTLKKFGYDEFKSLNAILKNKPRNYTVTVKLHPKEKKSKFKRYFEKVSFLKIKNINHICQNHKIIIGMTSMLLVELGIYRNDIMSLRINSRNNFFGNKLGLTKMVKNEKQLIKFFKKPPINNNKKFIENINSIQNKSQFILKKLQIMHKKIRIE